MAQTQKKQWAKSEEFSVFGRGYPGILATCLSGADFNLHPQCDFQSYTHGLRGPSAYLRKHGLTYECPV